MTHEELISFFSGSKKAADALGVSKAYVSQWRFVRIPNIHQISAQSISGGALKADEEALQWAAEKFPSGIGPAAA